jgi:hypothetical protein
MGRIIKGPAKEALAIKYAKLIAQGMPELEAWAVTFPAKAKKLQQQSRYNAHCQWKHDPVVIRAIRDATQHLRLNDLDNQGLAITALLQDMEAARRDNNHTALAAYNRLRLQANNLLKDNITVNDERTLPDAELLKQIAKATGIDIAELAPLRAKTGRTSTDDETKH